MRLTIAANCIARYLYAVMKANSRFALSETVVSNQVERRSASANQACLLRVSAVLSSSFVRSEIADSDYNSGLSSIHARISAISILQPLNSELNESMKTDTRRTPSLSILLNLTMDRLERNFECVGFTYGREL